MSSFLLNDTITFDVTIHDPTTSGEVNADSAPQFAVYEDGNDTAIGYGSMVLRENKTGIYRGSFVASEANGFEVGENYSLIVTAVVGGITANNVVFTASQCRDIQSFSDWTSAERNQLRFRLGIDGTVEEPQVANPDFLRATNYLGLDFTQQEHDNIVARIDVATSTRLAAASYLGLSFNEQEQTQILTNLDATVSSRFPASSYVAPDNTSIGLIHTWLNSMKQSDGEGGFQYTVKALELAPGSGISTGQARGVAAGPNQVDIDSDVNQEYYFYLYTYDENGASVTPDQLPTAAAANQLGESRNANLGIVTELGVGAYRVKYTVVAGSDAEQIELLWTHIQAGTSILTPAHFYVVDFIGIVDANIVSVNDVNTTGIDDFKADTFGLALETSVQTIISKTNNLPADPASSTDVTDAVSAITEHGDTYWESVDISALALESTVQAIKVKTDNLPVDPVSVGDLATLALEATSQSIKSQTDKIPANPVDTSDLSLLALEATAQAIKVRTDGMFFDDVEGQSLIRANTQAWAASKIKGLSMLEDDGSGNSRWTSKALEEAPGALVEAIISDMTEFVNDTYWRYNAHSLELAPTGGGGEGGGIELPPSPFLTGCNSVAFIRGDTWDREFILNKNIAAYTEIKFGIKDSVESEVYRVLISMVDGLLIIEGDVVPNDAMGKVEIVDDATGIIRVFLDYSMSSKLVASNERLMELQLEKAIVDPVASTEASTAVQANAQILGDVIQLVGTN